MTSWAWSWWLNVLGSGLHFQYRKGHGAPDNQPFCHSGILCFKDFCTSSEGNRNIWSSSGLSRFLMLAIGNATRRQCGCLVQQVTDRGSKGYWCLAENWVYLCRWDPRQLVFSFLVVMNHGVRTNRQLDRLHPHKGFPGWEREANGWRGLNRHETMTGNMAGTGLQNEGPGLHVWLVEMLVTSFFLHQKTHCIFFPCWCLWLCRTPPVSLCPWRMEHFAVSIWVWGLRDSFSIWRTLDVALLAKGFQWCCQAF